MSTFIQINKQHALASDSNQWLVQKYTGVDKKTNKQVWANIKYCPTLGHAAKCLYELTLRESDAKSLKELQEIGNEIKQEINTAVGVELVA